MTRKVVLVLSAIVAGALALVLGSNDGHAVKKGWYWPGAMCQPQSGAGHQYSGYWGGRFHNTKNDWNPVTCPLPEQKNDGFDPNDYDVRIWLWDRNPGSGKDFSCRVKACDYDSGSCYQSSEVATSGSTSGPVQWVFTSVPAYSTWVRFIECTIPAYYTVPPWYWYYSQIVQYRIEWEE